MNENVVCILAAGQGRRVALAGEELPKALVSVGDVPALTRIMRRFPESASFVIATGEHGDLVREYVSLAHEERDVRWVTVSRTEGPGTGPGLALQACRPPPEGPFHLVACDTLVTEDIDAGEGN